MRRHEGLVAAYLRRLEQESYQLSQRFPSQLSSVYIGGGTPSHLQDSELARIVHMLHTHWRLAEDVEFTLEADPLTFDPERLAYWQTLGITRLSIGLQSTQDAVLRFLGRRHNAMQGLEAIDWALAAGFAVSADLIIAVPGQNAAQDIHRLATSGVQHLSVYSLTIEPHTPFALRGVQVDETQDYQDYLLAYETLQGYGLARYEVSNYARPGWESRHNQYYWSGDYFLALGPSAASLVPSRRSGILAERQRNPLMKAWLEGEAGECWPLDARRFYEDMLITGLRTAKGVDMLALEQRCGQPLETFFGKVPAQLLQEGWLEHHPPYLRASDAGLLRLNSVLQRLLRASEPREASL